MPWSFKHVKIRSKSLSIRRSLLGYNPVSFFIRSYKERIPFASRASACALPDARTLRSGAVKLKAGKRGFMRFSTKIPVWRTFVTSRAMGECGNQHSRKDDHIQQRSAAQSDKHGAASGEDRRLHILQQDYFACPYTVHMNMQWQANSFNPFRLAALTDSSDMFVKGAWRCVTLGSRFCSRC